MTLTFFLSGQKKYFDQPKLQGSDYVEKEQPVSVKTNMFKIILGLGLLITNPPSRKIIVFVFSWICICPTLTKVGGVWAGRSYRNSCIALAPVPLICVIYFVICVICVIYWHFESFVYPCSLHGICNCGFVISYHCWALDYNTFWTGGIVSNVAKGWKEQNKVVLLEKMITSSVTWTGANGIEIQN